MMERMTSDLREDALYQLSIRGRMVSFQCKRGNEGNASELSFSSLQFNTEHNSFLGADDVGVLCRYRTDMDIVTCACVYDVQKRVSTPFILLKKGHKEGRSKYVLLALGSSMEKETKLTFNLPYQLRENVHIAHGPIVLWTHEGLGFHTSAIKDQDVGVVRPTPPHVSCPLIGVLPLHKGDVFVIGPLADQFRKGVSPTDVTGHQIAGQSMGYLLESADVFDAAVMIPSAYIPIARSILVLSAERVNGVLTRCSVVAATSEKQLVHFENGVPRDVCLLPFEAPEAVHLVDTGRNGLLIAVRFEQGHVCLVWKESFQVAAHWSAVRGVHVEDFLGCGTEQLLLVFEDKDVTGRPLDNFLLTDLCGISLSSGQQNQLDASSHQASHNHLLTFQALESRLQSGLAAVQELQGDDRLKQRVLLQSIQALADLVSGRGPVLTQPEQEGLFSLWDEDDEPAVEVRHDEKMQVEAPEEHVTSCRPLVERLWHRVMEDQLVVGATLTVDAASPVDCVSLSVLTNAGSAPAVIQTRSRAFLLASPASPAPPGLAAKRRKWGRCDRDDDGPGQTPPSGPHRLAVTAVTELASLLGWGRVKCPVMLDYVRPATAPQGRPQTLAFQCGEVSVDVRTDLRSRLQTDPVLATEEDLLGLLSVLDCWDFQVDSPHHSLGDMERRMQRATPCERLKVDPRYLLAHSEGPSAAMLLRWSPSSAFRGELSVRASRLQMLRFLELLSGSLLASCSLRPLRGSGPRPASRVLSLALESEALALKRAATSLLRGDEGRGGGRGRDAGAPEDERERRRREWDEELGRSRGRLSPPVDAGEYRRLTRGLAEVRLWADVAVLLQNQTT